MNEYHRSQYRLPIALYERLKAASAQSGHSLNAELVERLESTFAFEEAPHNRTMSANELRMMFSKMRLTELMTPAEIDAIFFRFLEQHEMKSRKK